MLNIYHVERTDDTGYDEQCTVVVIAGSELSAREHASSEHGDEGYDRWFINTTKVSLLGKAIKGLEAGIVCRDFHAG